MRNHRLHMSLVTMLVLAMAGLALAGEPARSASAAKRSGETPRYDVLGQIHVPTFADSVVEKLNAAIATDLGQQKSGESDEDYAIRKQFGENVAAGLTSAIKQLGDVSIGWRIDRQKKSTNVDLTMSALPDSSLAKRCAQAKELKTSFGGFVVQGAALTGHGVAQASPEEAAAAVKLIKLIREKELKKSDAESASDEEKRIRRELAGKLFDVIEETAASGRSDGAFSVVIKPKQLTLVAAGYVADGAKLESVVKPVATWLQQNHPLFTDVKLDVEKFEGVSLHTLSIPAPQDDNREKFVAAFGETLEVVVGFGKEASYLAAGRDAMKSLKDAIAKSTSPTVPANPFEISLALQPVADLIAAMGNDFQKGPAQMAAGVLEKAKGKDHLRIVAKASDRGFVLRTEIEEGVLELIGAINPEAKKFFLGQ